MSRYLLPLFLLGFLLTTGCAAPMATTPARHTIAEFEKPGAPRPLAVPDPIAPVNKGLYRFNYYFDKFLFIPVVSTYEFILPDLAQQGVSNFMDNLGEIKNFLNSTLQAKPKSEGITLARFAINSTVGIAWLWDPASRMKLQRQDEDFGQTLGRYGSGGGPFVVLPVLGPSNLRDTVGYVGDTLAFNFIDPLNFDHNGDWELPYTVTNAVDARHRQPFRYYRSGSPFEYEWVRMLYTEKRNLQIAK